MKKTILAIAAAATLAVGTLSSGAASADPFRGGWGGHHGFYRHGGYPGGGFHRGGFYGGNRGFYGGDRGFYRGGRGYYGGHRGYYRGYRHGGYGDALAAGAIGLGVGAILGSQLTAPSYRNDGYYGAGYYGRYEGGYYGRPVYEPRAYRAYGGPEACAARYRSYDYRTNTFLGYDGYRHPCRL